MAPRILVEIGRRLGMFLGELIVEHRGEQIDALGQRRLVVDALELAAADPDLAVVAQRFLVLGARLQLVRLVEGLFGICLCHSRSPVGFVSGTPFFTGVPCHWNEWLQPASAAFSLRISRIVSATTRIESSAAGTPQ